MDYRLFSVTDRVARLSFFAIQPGRLFSEATKIAINGGAT